MYNLVYSEDAVRGLLNLRSLRKRDSALRFLEHLASDPFTLGDLELNDNSGRKNEIAILPGLMIVYWADHAAKEVRIVEVRQL